MANMALLTDPEEMRTASNAISALAEEFDSIRLSLKAAIEQTLNSECAGDIADEFTKYYNDNIDVKLVEEKERIDGVAKTVLDSANNFDETGSEVKAFFNR